MAAISKYITAGITLSHSIDEKPSDRSFSLHMHDNYELYCFVSGKASYMVEGNIYELRPGTVLIMRSLETHKLIVNGGERYERFTVNFYPEALCQRGMSKGLLAPFTNRTTGEKNIYYPEDVKSLGLLDMFRKTIEECAVLQSDSALYFNLCSMLCAVACAFEKYPESRVYSTERDMDRALLNYINDNITKELSVESICRYAHISSTQLSRKFKELTGTTVYQYILSKRLVLAQRHIAKGKSVQLAAQESGFGDYSCFYRMYKKRYGCAPNDGKKTIEKE